jgi:hypothetical protein
MFVAKNCCGANISSDWVVKKNATFGKEIANNDKEST